MDKPYLKLTEKFIPLTEFKNNFSSIIQKMNDDNQERILLKKNKPAAVIVPENRYDQLMKIEEEYNKLKR